MENQTMILTNSAAHQPFYTSYHTPPYTLNYSSWSETSYQPIRMNEDVSQMQQQLRFPTPPITPPRSFNSTTAGFEFSQPPAESDKHSNKVQQQRTQSVIMKIGYDQNPQYLTANLHYNNFEKDSQSLHAEFHEQTHNQLKTRNDDTSSPTSQNEFTCDWKECGRYFASLELLAQHVTLIHAVATLNDGLYYCRWTGCQRTERGFNARYKMLVHVRTHTKEKPHQCHLCDKRFSRAENLKIHIRSHSGEKPYICTFEGCKKAYSNSSDRFKHTRTHSMEKPYKCKVPGCQKRYTDPSSLRKHVKTFKHSSQLFDFKATANVQQSTAINNLQDESHASHKYLPYLPLLNESSTTAPQDSFCLALEEMCHIKGTLHCYSGIATALNKKESHWSQKEAKIEDTLYFQQAASCDIQLDFATEKPLDLRMKRA